MADAQTSQLRRPQSASKPDGAQPGINLPEGVCLPLVSRTTVEVIGLRDEVANTRRAIPIRPIEFFGDVLVSFYAAGVLKQWLACLGKCFDPIGIILDTVMHVVGMLLLMPTIQGIPFHRRERRDRANGHLDSIGSPAGHVARDCNELIEGQCEVSTIGPLNGKVADERGLFFTISASRGIPKSTTILIGWPSSAGTSRMS